MRDNFYHGNLRFLQAKTATSRAGWKYLFRNGKTKAMDSLHKKVEEVSYPLGDNDCYIDESWDILKSILNDDVSTDSDGEVDDM